MNTQTKINSLIRKQKVGVATLGLVMKANSLLS